MKTIKTFTGRIMILTLASLLLSGISYSQDFWQQTEMPPHLSIWSLVADHQGNVFAGGYGQGLFKSSDHGITWDSSGMTGYWVVSLAVNSSGDLFLAGIGGTWGSGIFKSSDHGESWTKIFGFDNDYAGFNFVYVGTDNSVWTGLNYSPEVNGIYRSVDNGSTWEKVFTDTQNFSSMVMTEDGKVYAAAYGRIYYSHDGGNSWNYSETGLVPCTIPTMTTDVNGKVYAATAGYGIYRTDDDGLSWTMVKGAGPDYSCLIVDADNNFYVASRGYWVYRSTDNAETWQLLKDGLTNKYVLSLTIDDAGYLYAGTDTSGVFRSKEKVVSGIKTHDELTIKELSLFPNPAHGQLTITYSLARSSQVALTIYDNNGKTLKNIIEGKKIKGKHETRVNVSDLPPGVYLCVVRAGNAKTESTFVIR